MPLGEVLAVLDALQRAGVRAWLDGGWGVDALVGRQTRPHRDLDLALDVRDEAAALAALHTLGYEIETDWRPTRVELAAPGSRWVDLHPLTFEASGDGIQLGPAGERWVYPADGFATGSVGGRTVGCISAAQQILFHSGYELRDRDRHDLTLLRSLLEAPDSLRAGRRCWGRAGP
jgi:lincosamide nucleotidyltransferase A/C/D/E